MGMQTLAHLFDIVEIKKIEKPTVAFRIHHWNPETEKFDSRRNIFLFLLAFFEEQNETT